MPETSTVEAVKEFRKDLDSIEQRWLALKADAANRPESPGENRGEVLANFALAFRHLEDARMRAGKVIQAVEGGTNKFDAAAPNSGIPAGGLQ